MLYRKANSMSKYTERAEFLFRSGYNCSQSVFCAFADEIGLTEEQAARASIGLGGGVGRMREVCGAISGAAMAVGLLRPDFDKAKVYETVREITAEFKKSQSSIICKDLLGLKEVNFNEKPEPRTEEFYLKRPCLKIICDAVSATEKVLFSKESE